jgi:diguanylate cyclase (GGDEF)-like protein/PAS domain S-box-containing protein
MFEDHHDHPYQSLLQSGTNKIGEKFSEVQALQRHLNEGLQSQEHPFNSSHGQLSKFMDDTSNKGLSPIQSAISATAPIDKQSFISIVLNNIHDAVIITNTSGNIIYLNLAAERLIGWNLEDNRSLSINDILISPDEINIEEIKLSNFLNSANLSLLNSSRKFGWMKDKDNQLKKIDFSLNNFDDDNLKIKGMIFILREIVEQENSQISSNIASYDSLTGLMNRAIFESHLEKILESIHQTSNTHTLCYLNLDRFKIINETCGHYTGDQFLQEISRILQNRVRRTDIISRLGGDEFGIVLQNCNLEESQKIIKSLADEIQKLNFIWQDHKFSFTVSMGVCLIRDTARGHIELLSAAKSACDIAKQNGRNRIHIYQDNDSEITIQRGEIQWIPKIFKALEENNFKLYKQQIVSLEHSIYDSIAVNSCCEILIRMQNKNEQLTPPGSFIPTAEKYGLMPMIDRWVVQTLFDYLQNSKNDEFNLYMINLSGASLNDDAFLGFIEEKLNEFQICPQMLCFEITETIAISNLAKTTHLIHRLKEMGCHFALDDFGSGMSSFGYLKSLPVDFVKIDGMFIKDIAQNPVAREIVEAINRIAHVMGIKTIAEYVEDAVTYQHLQQLNVDFAQGFGILKPSIL